MLPIGLTNYIVKIGCGLIIVTIADIEHAFIDVFSILQNANMMGETNAQELS